jgi:hypothetical protein
MASNRYRLRFTFWLDMVKPEEHALADNIELLKNEKSFAKTVRDGIRLIIDLRNGKTDTLFELFPWVKDKLLQGAPEQNSLHLQLERLERLIMQSKDTLHTPSIQSPKTLNVPKFDLPTFDDDDLDTVVLTKDVSSQSAQNFINSMLALQQ